MASNLEEHEPVENLAESYNGTVNNNPLIEIVIYQPYRHYSNTDSPIRLIAYNLTCYTTAKKSSRIIVMPRKHLWARKMHELLTLNGFLLPGVIDGAGYS